MMCLYRHGDGRFTASSLDGEFVSEIGLLATARILRRRSVPLRALRGRAGFIDLGYLDALAAATGTAKTRNGAECEASQSGGEAVTPNTKAASQKGVRS